jgi:hypothetical protein
VSEYLPRCETAVVGAADRIRAKRAPKKDPRAVGVDDWGLQRLLSYDMSYISGPNYGQTLGNRNDRAMVVIDVDEQPKLPKTDINCHGPLRPQRKRAIKPIR